MTAAEGPLSKMRVEPGAAAGASARYWLRVGAAQLALHDSLGLGVEIKFLDSITCSYCQAPTRRSYGGGYCYGCFTRLARCDLCVVSPDRCHYAAGTCREPAWGEQFCMREHLVYLANSSGAKVGLTAAGNELNRWLDQGAVQGLVILRAATRAAAGLAEAQLAKSLTDRTDWRILVSRDVPAIDLVGLRDQLKADSASLPAGVGWHVGQVQALRYPVLRYGRRLTLLRLQERPVVRGNLLGIKGQYLLFDHGVFNVRHHTSFHVRVNLLSEPVAPGAQDDQQLELFE